MAFADIGDVRLFFTDEGDGHPVLLFVHGYTCDSHDWSWQLPYFVASHRVIAVDLRGHGRSSAPEHGYGALDFASDLAGLLDTLKVERVVAFGHSMGGVVVSALAVEHPERVDGLVCVDPAYLLPDETRDRRRAGHRRPRHHGSRSAGATDPGWLRVGGLDARPAHLAAAAGGGRPTPRPAAGLREPGQGARSRVQQCALLGASHDARS